MGDGKRLKKSTKQTDREKALIVCLAMAGVEEDVAKMSFTEQQLRKVINDALARVGERKLVDPTIRGSWTRGLRIKQAPLARQPC
jgi:hypothetical protein